MKSLAQESTRNDISKSRSEATGMPVWRYEGPQLALRPSFSDFDFTIEENGKLRFTFWMISPGAPDFYAFYDDTINVRPNNEI